MTRVLTADRRAAMKFVAASISGLTGCSSLRVTTNSASTASDNTEFKLGARRSGWEGIAPEQYRGNRNPLLRMAPGVLINLTWENLDGKRHRLDIEDSLGRKLVQSTESSQSGDTRTVTFRASEEMTTYLDPQYPVYMRGELLVTGN